MVYLAGSGTVALKLGAATAWDIAIDTPRADKTVLGDLWTSALLGPHSWSGSIKGLLDTTDTSPFDAATAMTSKALYFYPSSADLAKYYYGSIWPTLSISLDKGAVVNFTLNFGGDGQLAQK